MNVQRFGIIATAIAINVLVLAWFGTRPPVSVASTSPATRGDTVVTLPVVHVYPSAEQLRELRRERMQHAARPTEADGRAACFAMPYYAFASPCATADG